MRSLVLPLLVQPPSGAGLVDATKRPVKRCPKALRKAPPLHKFRDPKEQIAAPNYAERVKSDYQAIQDLGIKSTKSLRDWRAIRPALERAVKKGLKKKSFNPGKTSKPCKKPKGAYQGKMRCIAAFVKSYVFVVPPPPPQGGNRHFVPPPPPRGELARQKEGYSKGGGGGCSIGQLCP